MDPQACKVNGVTQVNPDHLASLVNPEVQGSLAWMGHQEKEDRRVLWDPKALWVQSEPREKAEVQVSPGPRERRGLLDLSEILVSPALQGQTAVTDQSDLQDLWDHLDLLATREKPDFREIVVWTEPRDLKVVWVRRAAEAEPVYQELRAFLVNLAHRAPQVLRGLKENAARGVKAGLAVWLDLRATLDLPALSARPERVDGVARLGPREIRAGRADLADRACRDLREDLESLARLEHQDLRDLRGLPAREVYREDPESLDLWDALAVQDPADLLVTMDHLAHLDHRETPDHQDHLALLQCTRPCQTSSPRALTHTCSTTSQSRIPMKATGI